MLHVAHHGSLGHGPQGQDVADGESRLLPAVHKLAGVHALGGDEPLLLPFEPERVAERHLAQRGTTAAVVHDLGDHTLDVSITLGEIQRPELRRAFAAMRVGAKDGPRSLTLGTDDSSHCGGRIARWRAGADFDLRERSQKRGLGFALLPSHPCAKP